MSIISPNCLLWKNASENAFCWSHLLHVKLILSYRWTVQTQISLLHRSSLILVYTVCYIDVSKGPAADIEISENRYLPCRTKIIDIYEIMEILQIVTCPAAWGTRKNARTSGFFLSLPADEHIGWHLSSDMRFPTKWYVRPAKAQTSLRICAVWSEPLLFARIFYKS